MSGDFLALLGSKGGPMIRPGSPMPTSSFLRLAGQEVVVDCGLGVTRGLVDQGRSLRDLRAIFITHLHSDHYLELGPLIHTAWTAGLKQPVDVWGPVGLAGYWDGFLASMADDIEERLHDEGRPDLRGLVRLHGIEAGREIMVGPLRVQAIPALHPPLKEAWSLRFSGHGKSVVFSGDTAPNPALEDLARGAEVLVHEAMLLPGLEALMARIGNGDDRLMKHWLRSHTEAGDAGRIAARAGVGRLVLHHLIPSDDPAFGEADWIAAVAPHWKGPLVLARDGLRVEV